MRRASQPSRSWTSSTTGSATRRSLARGRALDDLFRRSRSDRRDGSRSARTPLRRRRAVTSAVLDASAAIELITRRALGLEFADSLAPVPVLWVPDGLFDVEVHAVLRRWELNGMLAAADVTAARLRLANLRLRRGRIGVLVERAWQLRSNVTFPDVCYVALAETLGCPLITGVTLRIGRTRRRYGPLVDGSAGRVGRCSSRCPRLVALGLVALVSLPR